jgi:beta-N-acetylhexosaminidase
MTKSIGCLIVDIQGTVLDPLDRDILSHPSVGGVILFTRNYESRAQLGALCADIRQSTTHPRLILVDQEGGRVQRFIPEFTQIPPMSTLGEAYDRNPINAYELARNYGKIMAAELISLKIDLSLAPVLDLNKGISGVIGDRAFHHHPDIVAALAESFIKGMRDSGMAATGKHFPGHGSVVYDSHVSIARDERTLSDIEQNDMKPFERLIQSDHLSAIMTSHVIFPNVDALPVTYSSFWLKKILRNRLNFKRAIWTDDLNMEGANISSHYKDRVVTAREAGCDFTLLCNNRFAVIQVLDQLPYLKSQVDYDRWAGLGAQFINKIL